MRLRVVRLGLLVEEVVGLRALRVTGQKFTPRNFVDLVFSGLAAVLGWDLFSFLGVEFQLYRNRHWVGLIRG